MGEKIGEVAPNRAAMTKMFIVYLLFCMALFTAVVILFVTEFSKEGSTVLYTGLFVALLGIVFLCYGLRHLKHWNDVLELYENGMIYGGKEYLFRDMTDIKWVKYTNYLVNFSLYGKYYELHAFSKPAQGRPMRSLSFSEMYLKDLYYKYNEAYNHTHEKSEATSKKQELFDVAAALVPDSGSCSIIYAAHTEMGVDFKRYAGYAVALKPQACYVIPVNFNKGRLIHGEAICFDARNLNHVSAKNRPLGVLAVQFIGRKDNEVFKFTSAPSYLLDPNLNNQSIRQKEELERFKEMMTLFENYINTSLISRI